MINVLVQLKRVFGLFSGEEGGNPEPLAWMLIYSDGSAGMLKTREAHRNKGYGSFLLRRVVEKVLELGLVPCVHIEDDNEISKRFFRKFGFVQGDFSQWIFHNP